MRAAVTTHYDVMGVGAEASTTEIKRAYYRRARSYHPDAHSGSTTVVMAEAAKAMAELNAAWNVLRDPILRGDYDRRLAEAAERAASARRRTHRGRRAQAKPLIGAGFAYWYGGIVNTTPGANGQPRYNLVVDGATDLSSLRRLAPDGLWALHAVRADISDDQLIHLSGMHGMGMLDLTGTHVTDAGMVHLQGLDQLESLSLWDTAIGDGAMRLIGRMSNLRNLSLGNTTVTDAGLEPLAALSELRLIQLSGTQVAGPGLVYLHKLPNLEFVTLPRRVGFVHRRRLRRAIHGALVE